MIAPFIDMTIGDMWRDAPGKLNSLGITVEDSTTWEYDTHFKFTDEVISKAIDKAGQALV